MADLLAASLILYYCDFAYLNMVVYMVDENLLFDGSYTNRRKFITAVTKKHRDYYNNKDVRYDLFYQDEKVDVYYLPKSISMYILIGITLLSSSLFFISLLIQDFNNFTQDYDQGRVFSIIMYLMFSGLALILLIFGLVVLLTFVLLFDYTRDGGIGSISRIYMINIDPDIKKLRSVSKISIPLVPIIGLQCLY